MMLTGLDLELGSGLTASSIARAALGKEFGDSLSAEQLMDLRLAVSSMINYCIRSQDAGPIRVRVWTENGSIHGEVSDRGGGAELLRQRQRRGYDGLNVLGTVTREWGTDGTVAWFIV